MNREEARFWLCAAVLSTCAWIASSDAALRTFFATVSGFGCSVLVHFAITWFVSRRRAS